MSVEADRVAAFKEATNFRSVTRNDPSVLEIVDTSNYSVIYHYDEAAGEWEKQKQEGPLFVVRRDKTPEYALFMLNRQAVKNVTIALVPGEMKATIGDTTTLHLARRGERLRRGIWFSDAGDVDRFRETILRICGEPTKRPGGSTSSPSVVAPAPVASTSASSAAPANDGFARLFAGLQTASTPPAPRIESVTSIPPPTPQASSYTPQHVSPGVSAPRSETPPISQPVSAVPAQPVSYVPDTFVQPPGQTVDDLLNSILGIAAPSKPAQPAPSAPTPQSRVGSSAAHPHTTLSPPLPPPHPLTSMKVGNASFAQAAGATSPIPPTTRPNLVQTNSTSSFNDPPVIQSPQPLPSQPVPSQQQQHSSQSTFSPPPLAPNGHFSSPMNHNNFGPMVPGPHGPMGSNQMPPMVKGQIAKSVVDAVSARKGDEGVRKVEQVNEVGKRMFVQDLLHLFHTDQTFVEEVWRGYLARAGPGY